MTRVEYTREGRAFAMRVTGHAGYAPDGGPDIVCAAVSALACTLLGRLDGAESRGELEALEYRQESGDVYARAVPGAGSRAEIAEAFETVATGFEMLAEAYPEHVALKRAEGEKKNLRFDRL